MQGYVPAQDGAFAESRKCFGELEDWMASAEAAGLQHAELEEQLDVRGRELLRRLFQDRLDLTAAREERRHDVTGEDGVVRTRAERGRTRPLVTKFGQVSVSRIAYRSPGRQQRAPAGRGAEPAGGEALPRAAQARRDRGRARLDRGGGRRDHPRDRRDDRETAAGGAGPPLRRARGGVLPAARGQPGPGRSCAGADLRREGHRDAARSAAAGHREGRGRGGGQARHPAVTGGEERPQADGRAGLRLRRRPGPAHPRGHHQHPRAEGRRRRRPGRPRAGESRGSRRPGASG